MKTCSLTAALLAIAMAGTLVAGPTLAGEPLPVFVLAGQSNMVGAGKADELPYDLKKPQENALYTKFWGVKLVPFQPKKNGHKKAQKEEPL